MEALDVAHGIAEEAFRYAAAEEAYTMAYEAAEDAHRKALDAAYKAYWEQMGFPLEDE